MTSILNVKGILVDDGNWSSIEIHIFHALDILDHYKISSIVLMGNYCSNSTSLFVSYVRYSYFRKFYPRVKHFPLLSEVCHKKAEKSHLNSHHNYSFWILLGTNSFIDAHDSSDIVDVAEDNYIIFQAILLTDLCIELINIYFII